MVRPMWWGVVLLAAFGLAVMLACDSGAPAAIAGPRCRRIRARQLLRPQRTRRRRGAHRGRGVVGIAAIADPLGLIEPLIVVAGVLAAALRDHRDRPCSPRASRTGADAGAAPTAERAGSATGDDRRRRAGRPGQSSPASCWLARPGPRRRRRRGRRPATGTVCNGHAELCDRRFDEVAYVASHNAMSVGHRAGLVPRRAGRLDPGPARPRRAGAARRRVVRDPCRHGRAHGAGKLRRGARHRRGGARPGGRRRRSAHRRLGRRRGHRDRGAVHVPRAVRDRVDPVPRHARPAARLDGRQPRRGRHVVHRGPRRRRADRRRHRGGRAARRSCTTRRRRAVADARRDDPLRQAPRRDGRGGRRRRRRRRGSSTASSYTQDTPYTFPTVESFSCDANRGPDDAPLLLLNHWLSGFTLAGHRRPTGQRPRRPAPARRAVRRASGQLPNFVAVNYVAIGDVFEVVDTLNGVA